MMTKQPEIRILSVDDHRLFREGIATVIKDQPDMLLVAEAASGPEALQRFREYRPDVTLMDVRLRDLSGMDAMIAILTKFPEARVILVSTFDGDLQTQAALQAGACGHILKTMHPREIVDAIRQVHAGKKAFLPPKSARADRHATNKRLKLGETEAQASSADGNRSCNIAQQLSTSQNTLKTHLKRFIKELGARDQTDAVNFTQRRGLI